ncbi:MAG: hypothetical protein JWM81_667 [Candidatus Saccharibacteria bacterium]|nr:hypothetical protein [Candidatus Saccharibacteria bacterium]
MTESLDGNTLAEMLFAALSKRVGTATVRAIIARGEAEQLAGRQGITVSNPEAGWSMAVAESGLSFQFGEWGPVLVEVTDAATIVNSIDAAPSSN